ncbi:MAG: hypothetical protein IKF07_01940 [Eubacterium sp.]|nr:hypothetical protein [Eubacterium sp.]
MSRKKEIGFILIVSLMISMFSHISFIDRNMNSYADTNKAVRTVMLYDCGSNLESWFGMATFNLLQVLKANFSDDEDVRFIVMTGGSNLWRLEKEYISIDPKLVPEGEPVDSVSAEYNQIWEAKGADSEYRVEPAEGPAHGKIVLLDGDGVTGNEPVKSKDELMSDPDTLKAFINYCEANYPADKYDLILWNHGGGPVGGFGVDDHEESIMPQTMPFIGIVDALRDNNVTKQSDDDPSNDAKFDFIDFDACLMNNVELNLILADYMDYYIASPELEPGYGQEYSGWLNMLGQKPDIDTFELGKKIVDDFEEFYTNGEGKGQDGTLAVVDTKKLMNSEFKDALCGMADVMNNEMSKKAFYDELRSVDEAIQYGDDDLFDLGNLAGLLGVVKTELNAPEGGGEGDDPDYTVNDYLEFSKKISQVLGNDEIIYAYGTDNICSKDKIVRDSDGSVEYKNLYTSGMQMYFPQMMAPHAAAEYYDVIGNVIDTIRDKENDTRYKFLDAYRNAMIDYALVMETGKAISEIVNEAHVPKTDIDFNKVKAYWTDGEGDPFIDEYSEWSLSIKQLFDKRSLAGHDEAETETWLDEVIKQQAAEALSIDNITASTAKQKSGTGYEIHISDVKKRVIKSVEMNASFELPALKKYLTENFESEQVGHLYELANTSLGTIQAVQYPPTESWQKMIDWYSENKSDWEIDPFDNTWFAINDASGENHVAAVYKESEDQIEVACITGDIKDPDKVVLIFDSDDGHLSEMYYVTKSGDRPVKPSELSEEITLMPSVYVNMYGFLEYYLPISKKAFNISAANADDITLEKTKISEINDISDFDGDGEVINSRFTVTDIYDKRIDISDIVNNTESHLISIDLARTRPGYYTGDDIEPQIEYRGELLQPGVDYEWEFFRPDDGPDLIEPGLYLLDVKGKGRFTDETVMPFKIIYSEEDANAIVDAAQLALEEADKAIKAAIETGNAEQLNAAYELLVDAQNKLAQANDILEETMETISAYDLGVMQDKIDELEDKVEDLTNQLSQALVIDISNYAVTMKKTKYVYNGQYIQPEVEVSGLKPSDYKVDGDVDNGMVGIGKIYIRANSYKYKGEIVKTFTVVPGKAAINSVKPGKKKMTVKAKKKVSETGGDRYEIQYRIKGAKKWKKAVSKKQSCTIRKLRSGKQYQVRIRAYKRVDKKTYYGAWSTIKTSKRIK